MSGFARDDTPGTMLLGVAALSPTYVAKLLAELPTSESGPLRCGLSGGFLVVVAGDPWLGPGDATLLRRFIRSGATQVRAALKFHP